MIKSIVTTFIVLFGLSMNAQHYDFPLDWVGDYAGTMHMFYPTVDRIDTVEVHFELKEIIADSSWTYIMTYKSEKYGDITKAYQMVKPSKDNDYLFHLDEKDGIIIEQILMDNTFYSSFSVMGSYISSRMRRVEGGIEFEITSAKEEATSSSKSEPVETEGEVEESVEVFSYLPFTVQRVFFNEVD